MKRNIVQVTVDIPVDAVPPSVIENQEAHSNWLSTHAEKIGDIVENIGKSIKGGHTGYYRPWLTWKVEIIESEMEIMQHERDARELIGAQVTDVELHRETGDLLTIYMRARDGRLLRLVPVDYKMVYSDTPYFEDIHGGAVKLDSLF